MNTSAPVAKCKASMSGSAYDPQWVDELEMLDAIFDD